MEYIHVSLYMYAYKHTHNFPQLCSTVIPKQMNLHLYNKLNFSPFELALWWQWCTSRGLSRCGVARGAPTLLLQVAVWVWGYLLLVAAAVGLLQRPLQEVQTDLVDGRLEEIVLHQTGNQKNTRFLVSFFNKKGNNPVHWKKNPLTLDLKIMFNIMSHIIV